MRIALFIALLSSALLFGGCSSLKSQKVTDQTLPDKPIEGSIPYALPKKTLTVSATYVLTACKTELNDKQQPILRLDANINASVVGTNEADGDERYRIPYADMRSWLKDVSITVETYPNQTLKSLNGSITDQSGAVLTATIGTAIKIAGLALAGAVIKASDEMCDPIVLAQLKRIDDLRTLLAATSPKPPESEATRYTKEIATITADLTTKTSMVWTPSLQDFGNGDSVNKVLSSNVALKKWLTPNGLNYLAAQKDGNIDVNVLLEVPKWARPAKEKQQITGSIPGIVIADPAIGTIRLCKGPCPTPSANGTQADGVLQVTSAAFPQLGGKLILPLQNFFAQTSQLELAVAEDGVITKLGVKNTSTAATTITALGGNVDAARAAVEANEKAKAAAQTAAQTKARDDNKILADCLDAHDKIISKGGIPTAKCQ